MTSKPLSYTRLVGIFACLAGCAAEPDGLGSRNDAVTAVSWQLLAGIDTSPTLVYPGAFITLHNLTNGQHLKYQSQSCGIALGWTSSPPDDFQLYTQDGSSPVKYGARVTLQEATGGHVIYSANAPGSKLAYSGSASYQWEVRGGTNGSGVYTLTNLSLYNVARGDYLVQCSSSCGMDLGWASSCQ